MRRKGLLIVNGRDNRGVQKKNAVEVKHETHHVTLSQSLKHKKRTRGAKGKEGTFNRDKKTGRLIKSKTRGGWCIVVGESRRVPSGRVRAYLLNFACVGEVIPGGKKK